MQWTGGESNPGTAAQRWSPGCKPSVFPLDQRPASIERSVPELNRVFLLTTEVCCQNTYRPIRVSDPGWNRTSTFLVVTQASLPLDHGIVFLISDRGGNRTHRHEALDLAAMPICVPGHKWRVRGSHPAVQADQPSVGARPGWALAHPRVAGPGIEPGEPASTMLRTVPEASWAPAAPAMFQ